MSEVDDTQPLDLGSLTEEGPAGLLVNREET